VKQCSGNGYQSCGNYDTDSCLEWSGITACPTNQTCQSGVCVASNTQNCSNECQLRGSRQCAENGYRVCGNYDSDSCLEWSAAAACGANQECASGVCRVNQTALRARIIDIQKLIQELMRQLAVLRARK
jgi:hypothetical protein